jgi:glutamyl-tRNA synthetase/glutamyl-Q tRNA(Asp) synthetase
VVRPDLRAWSSPVAPVTRFAPSPTGYLHLGHVVNAVYVWGVTKALGGQVRLRIEDHDRIRCRPEYEQALLDDLDWLGFLPDAGRDPLDRQSDRQQFYERMLSQLASAHDVYACGCSRRDIGSERYDGRCRRRGLMFDAGTGVRVVVAPGIERVDDLLMGPLEQNPSEQSGDLLLKDRDGHWTYQFAVTADDLSHGISLVIRGADLVSSTGRQVRLARMLGRITAPRFLHHPLIIGAHGEKLSKAARDTGIRELRAQGLTAAEVIGRAAAAVGLVPQGVLMNAAEVPGLFMTAS